MRRRIAQKGKSSGFTLVELMCSIVVLLVSVLAAFTTNVSSLNVIKTSRDTMTATADLEAAMERILTVAHDNIPLAGYYPSGTPISTFTGLHLRNESMVPTYPGGSTADPLTIRLTVTWTDWSGRARSATLSSMKAR